MASAVHCCPFASTVHTIPACQPFDCLPWSACCMSRPIWPPEQIVPKREAMRLGAGLKCASWQLTSASLAIISAPAVPGGLGLHVIDITMSCLLGCRYDRLQVPASVTELRVGGRHAAVKSVSLQNPEGLQRLTLHQGCTMVDERRLWASTHLQVSSLKYDMASILAVSIQPSFSWCCAISLQQ